MQLSRPQAFPAHVSSVGAGVAFSVVGISNAIAIAIGSRTAPNGSEQPPQADTTALLRCNHGRYQTEDDRTATARKSISRPRARGYATSRPGRSQPELRRLARRDHVNEGGGKPQGETTCAQ